MFEVWKVEKPWKVTQSLIVPRGALNTRASECSGLFLFWRVFAGHSLSFICSVPCLPGLLIHKSPFQRSTDHSLGRKLVTSVRFSFPVRFPDRSIHCGLCIDSKLSELLLYHIISSLETNDVELCRNG